MVAQQIKPRPIQRVLSGAFERFKNERAYQAGDEPNGRKSGNHESAPRTTTAIWLDSPVKYLNDVVVASFIDLRNFVLPR